MGILGNDDDRGRDLPEFDILENRDKRIVIPGFNGPDDPGYEIGLADLDDDAYEYASDEDDSEEDSEYEPDDAEFGEADGEDEDGAEGEDEEDDEDELIMLTLEDGTEQLFRILGQLDYEGETYLALAGAEDFEESDDGMEISVTIAHVTDDDGESYSVENIEDEMLEEKVMDLFREALEEEDR